MVCSHYEFHEGSLKISVYKTHEHVKSVRTICQKRFLMCSF
jgi:hypothetical protein